jgi:uncharacterized repeat protein (TIGR01451 family)/CSLREA domain-containing protein
LGAFTLVHAPVTAAESDNSTNHIELGGFMSPQALRHPSRLVLIALAVLAGCQSDTTTAPRQLPAVQFAQGDNGTWTVNSLSDPGDGTCDDTECTLREAIAAATPGGTIVVAAGLQGDIELAGTGLGIDKSLSIDGGGRIAIDAQNMSRGFVVGADGGPVTLSRLAVKNGYGTGNGGGIYLTSDATLDSVTVTASLAGGAGGGGVYISGSTVTIRNSTIAGNEAADIGGGIYANGSTVSIVGSTISGNETFDGGGIFINDQSSATIERSTISGNIGEDRGGGISNNGTLVVRSTAITRNTSLAGSGGITNNGNASLANSINAGNAGGPVDDCGGGNGPGTLGFNIVGASCNSAGPGDIEVTTTQLFNQVIAPTLADNGGPTKTHALVAGGRAIDAGYCPGETTDQRGLKRPVDVVLVTNVRDGCDIGPSEAQGPAVAVADLMVSQAVNKTSVKQGDLLTYSVRVQNLGSESAPNVVLTNVLSSGVTFVEAAVNKGTVTAPPKGETGTVTWNLGTMVSSANEVATITVTVLVRGKTTITNTASVTGDVSDPNTANNSAAITVSVAAGGTGGGGGGGRKP